jgi:EAL and modified HD-GYP domain-containing signal transduction protein
MANSLIRFHPPSPAGTSPQPLPLGVGFPVPPLDQRIKHALILLGEKQIKTWASLIALTSMGEDKAEELVIQAVVRARLCESLAASVGLAHRDQELFLVGMFSLIDAILDRPLHDILGTLSIADDVQAALLGERNRLRGILECVLAYEKGDWDELSEHAAQFGLDEALIPRLYLEAVAWGEQSFRATARAA